MGFNFDVLAIRGIEKQETWKRLGLELSTDDNSARVFDDIAYGYYLLPGWYIVEFEKYGATASDELLASASDECEIMKLEYYDSSNFSCTSSWSNRNKDWQVCHDLSKSVTDLQVIGSPPELFSLVKDAISKHYFSQSEEMRCDSFFAIPTSLFDLLTGFAAGRWTLKVGPKEILIPTKDSPLSELTRSSYSTSGEPESFSGYDFPLTVPLPPIEFTEQEREMEFLLEPIWPWLDAHLYEQTLSMLDEIQRKHPNSIKAKWVRSQCYEQMKWEAERKALLKEMIETEARTSTDFFCRASAWDALGCNDEYTLDIEKSKDRFGRIPLLFDR